LQFAAANLHPFSLEPKEYKIPLFSAFSVCLQALIPPEKPLT